MNMMNTEPSDGDTVAMDEDFQDIPMNNSGNGASLPTAEELRTTVNPRRQGSSSNRQKCQGKARLLVVLVIVFGVGVGIIALVSSGRSSNSRSSGANAPRRSQQEDVISYMAQQGVSDLVVLTTSGSPQNRASVWLAEVDGANLKVPQSTVLAIEGYKYMTRYILAVLYFATGGEAWDSQVNFMTGRDVCEWYSVFFNGESAFRKGVVCEVTSGSRLLVGLGVSKY